MAESDKYEVLEKIGQGSFGIINKVKRKSDGLILCRKEISYLKMSQKEKEQLQAELSILKELKHPNIVQYFERDHLKNTLDLHLYMEYCGNGDLGQVIKGYKSRAERVPEDFVWSVFTQLVTALYRCHYGSDPPDAGRNVLGHFRNDTKAFITKKSTQYVIIHRDLKPENVFLDSDNNVKLGDFGLSKIIRSHDFASTYVGTPYYMSPEICAAEKYTTASDIWSLGCLIYELCTWSPPFNARSHIELFTKIKLGKVAPLPPNYSAELQKVISSCLQVNSSARPQTQHLLSLPAVQLMRKEHEVVQLGKEITKAREAITRERASLRVELDGVLRREWEVKARLEIDKQVQAEMTRLQNIFEAELEKRVGQLVEERLRSQQSAAEPSRRSSTESTESISGTTCVNASSSGSQKSSSQTSQDSIKPAETSFGMGRLSLDSPASDVLPMKRSARTPFTRAHTIGVNAIQSPMDIQMGDQSPMSIACLALSPRKDGAGAGAPQQKQNIFAAAEKRWQPTNASAVQSPSVSDVDTSAAEDNDEDEEEDALMASPTRDPFKAMQARPSLARQRTMPANSKRMISAPTLFSQKPTPNPNVKRPASAVPTVATSPTRKPAGESPTRPRAVPKLVESGSPVRKVATNSNQAATLRSAGGKKDEGMIKTAMRNQMHGVHGRTLVELAQARAGGVPREKTEKSLIKEVPVWDPELDEMPSPFLSRTRKGLMM